jgi:hypothetical protein
MAVKARASNIGQTMGTRGTKRFIGQPDIAPAVAMPAAPAPAPAAVAKAPAAPKPKPAPAPKKPSALTSTKRGSANVLSTKSGKVVAVVVGGKKRAGGPVGKQLVTRKPAPAAKPKAPVRKTPTINRSTGFRV